MNKHPTGCILFFLIAAALYPQVENAVVLKAVELEVSHCKWSSLMTQDSYEGNVMQYCDGDNIDQLNVFEFGPNSREKCANWMVAQFGAIPPSIETCTQRRDRSYFWNGLRLESGIDEFLQHCNGGPIEEVENSVRIVNKECLMVFYIQKAQTYAQWIKCSGTHCFIEGPSSIISKEVLIGNDQMVNSDFCGKICRDLDGTDSFGTSLPNPNRDCVFGKYDCKEPSVQDARDLGDAIRQEKIAVSGSGSIHVLDASIGITKTTIESANAQIKENRIAEERRMEMIEFIDSQRTSIESLRTQGIELMESLSVHMETINTRASQDELDEVRVFAYVGLGLASAVVLLIVVGLLLGAIIRQSLKGKTGEV